MKRILWSDPGRKLEVRVLPLGFAATFSAGVVAAALALRLIRRSVPSRSSLIAFLLFDALVLTWSVWTFALSILPDARHQLTEDDRAVADSVLEVAFGCREALLSHTTFVAVSSDRRSVEWSCAWGPLGFVRFEGAARCVDHTWEGSGFGGPTRYGFCT